MVYPSFVEACPSCKMARPSEDLRPADPYAAPVTVVPALPLTKGVLADYLKDPEWVQGHAVVEAPAEAPSEAPSECKWCGRPPGSGGAHGDFLELPPANVTPESLENMRILREVNAELNFDKDMSLGQAQRDFDAEVMSDLLAVADALTETTGCGIPPALTEEFPEPVVSLDRERAKRALLKKSGCPAPGCRKNARENSPYCSKICSDRCGRIRKKALMTQLTDEEVKNLARIMLALETRGKR